MALEPRAGGVFQVKINDQHTAKGEFVEVTPLGRLSIAAGGGEPGPDPMATSAPSMG